ncbi:30S ribosomal protein S13 [Candidatus Peregrinibacteria bacterium]|jgi:small subunit ribosomal protein S13|nr:30S ribosomal protein S13 [Candidatus Peregrinibacteria bacterium]MBT3599094.1 30S ribosomal protein S13 [Candidatus Peregrinibacteria bacterium]MBT4367671.1 30S ribosomal protein S13 [Candidatus Peregrinibacteria bacterium]MBT4585449.1 30S ribosomal protein S13 [Candidatus Peregrinibacteria bacterium]MBT6730400.1 30S ribosomal protein S13 [Candidatus Peregrinibacteria bacterium]
MIRIAGVPLPGEKHIIIALTYIKGIGLSTATSILKELKIDENIKADDISEEDQARLRARIEKEEIEGELTRRISMDVKRLQDIGTLRGYRHRRKLPVRGQTSRRNARTKRGKKKTGLSGRVSLTKT